MRNPNWSPYLCTSYFNYYYFSSQRKGIGCMRQRNYHRYEHKCSKTLSVSHIIIISQVEQQQPWPSSHCRQDKVRSPWKLLNAKWSYFVHVWSAIFFFSSLIFIFFCCCYFIIASQYIRSDNRSCKLLTGLTATNRQTYIPFCVRCVVVGAGRPARRCSVDRPGVREHTAHESNVHAH